MNAPRATVPPWHLWGTTQVVTAPAVAPPFLGTVAQQGISNQMARIDYGRPDTFHWLFAANIIRADNAVLAGETGQISIFWQVTIGLGRSAVILPLDTFVFNWGPVAAFPTAQIFATTAEGPLRAAASTESNVIDRLVADGLQCQANIVYLTNITGAQPAQVQVSAHFAPLHHARPEWFMEQFPGGEEEGR